MLKVCLLVLSGVSLLPLTAHAMEEGDGWTAKGKGKAYRPLPQTPARQAQTPVISVEKEEGKEKGKEKEKEKGKEKPKLQKQPRGVHFSQVTGIIRRGHSVSNGEESMTPVVENELASPGRVPAPAPRPRVQKPSPLRAALINAQEEQNSLVERMKGCTIQSDALALIYPKVKAPAPKGGIPVDDLFVKPKQADGVIDIIYNAMHPLYVKKFLNKTRKGSVIDPEKMESYALKAMLNNLKYSRQHIHSNVFAVYKGIVIGNYEGITVQTQDASGQKHAGKVLGFDLMLDDNGNSIPLCYPCKDHTGQMIMLPLQMTASVAYKTK